MRVTVIFPDATVYVDGVARVIQMPAHDDNWRAIQWYGDRGDVEVRVGSAFSFEDPAILAPFIDAWSAAMPVTVPTETGKPATGVEEM